jgi:hypothetical protein
VAGSCAAPYLSDQAPSVDPAGDGSGSRLRTAPTVEPGDSLTVYGHWYTSTCNDTGMSAGDPMQPLPPVGLTLTLPGGSVEDLGRFTPSGPDMGFAAAVQVPAGAPAGLAVVADDQEHPATFSFRVGR